MMKLKMLFAAALVLGAVACGGAPEGLSKTEPRSGLVTNLAMDGTWCAYSGTATPTKDIQLEITQDNPSDPFSLHTAKVPFYRHVNDNPLKDCIDQNGNTDTWASTIDATGGAFLDGVYRNWTAHQQETPFDATVSGYKTCPASVPVRQASMTWTIWDNVDGIHYCQDAPGIGYVKGNSIKQLKDGTRCYIPC